MNLQSPMFSCSMSPNATYSSNCQCVTPVARPAHARLSQTVRCGLCRDNVLLTKQDKGSYTVKLVDFGFSEKIPRPGSTNEFTASAVGLSYAYASPEVMNGETPGPKADVYSFGILMWQLFSGKVSDSGQDTICACSQGHSKQSSGTAYCVQAPSDI